ncbi:MAG: hypothetical protein GXX96_26875 [Planctomycetaceae bacterium]|nr:hypothetical protein [Planctomycetaceae bacterium]
MNENLQEYADSRGLAVHFDRERGVIRGVKILGLQSRNGRTYRPDALSRAVPLYEGVKVNVNHPKAASDGPRDYQDRIGVIRNVAARAGEGLFGDFHFNPKHALAEQLLWDAEHAPQNVGFSHNVLARTSREGDTLVVEAITRVHSVDLVADPATTRGLFESDLPDDPPHDAAGDRAAPAAGAGDEPVAEPVATDPPAEARPDLVEQLWAEFEKRILQLQEEVDQLRSRQTVAERHATVQALLKEFGLSESEPAEPWRRHVVSDIFLESLTAAGDEQTMRRLIQERVDLVRSLTGMRPAPARPTSREQTLVDPQQPSDVKAFVRSISDNSRKGVVPHRNLLTGKID